MKTTVVGVAHPKGMSEDYDGFFYRANEFNKLAEDLIDKPVYFEHDPSCKIGQIISAWPGKGLKGTEMFVMFELDDKTLPGILADKMIQDEHICELSLGHACTIESSDGIDRVINKEAFEVSIVEKGARENTNIYQVYRYKKPAEKKYIKKYKNLSSAKLIKTMSEVTEKQVESTEVQKQDEIVDKNQSDAAEESEQVKVTESILEQFRNLQQQNKLMEEELSQFKENGKRLREDTLKNGVREFIMKTVEEEEGLKQYSSHMEKLMQDMVNAESATPMLQFLKCAAAKSNKSTVELEKVYQEKKEYEQQIKKLRTELESNDTPFLTKKSERIEAVASKKPVNTTETSQNQKYGLGPGLKKYNPNLWQQISNDILKHC